MYSSNATGNNIALGADAGKAITTGVNNTVIGSLQAAAGCVCTVLIGAGTCERIRVDNTGLYVNNVLAGAPTLTANGNLGIGTGAIASGNGFYNFAVGIGALCKNITGGNNNVAQGYCSLFCNTTGVNNMAVGCLALANNTYGANNFAQGYRALNNNTTGCSNFAQGFRALSGNTSGCSNIAFGCYALAQSTTTNHHVAMGCSALFANTTGASNVAIGRDALRVNTTGSNNIAIGLLSGCTLNGGNNNIFIGCNAQALTTTSVNTITLGDNTIATIRAQVTSITALSDRRDKTDIVDIPLGLNFINQIRPVKFTWNMRDGSKVGQGYAGFIAQELKEAMDYHQAKDWLELVISNDDESRYEASPGKLLPVMVKAIQELSAQNDALTARIVALEAKL